VKTSTSPVGEPAGCSAHCPRFETHSGVGFSLGSICRKNPLVAEVGVLEFSKSGGDFSHWVYLQKNRFDSKVGTREVSKPEGDFLLLMKTVRQYYPTDLVFLGEDSSD
jgi:hypothetical protein